MLKALNQNQLQNQHQKKLQNQHQNQPPKPAEFKKPEGGGGPHAHDEKPAEKAPPKPAEKAPSVPLHERFREIPTGNWNTQKVAITGFTAPSNRYFGSRALVAQTSVTPSNWNDQKSKVPGYTAPGNKYFATRQRLAYHPEAKKFGTWINDAPAGDQAKSAPPPPPPPPPQPEPQASAGSASDGKSKQAQLEDYEKDYLARLEQKKVDDAKAVAEAAKASKPQQQPLKYNLIEAHYQKVLDLKVLKQTLDTKRLYSSFYFIFEKPLGLPLHVPLASL